MIRVWNEFPPGRMILAKKKMPTMAVVDVDRNILTSVGMTMEAAGYSVQKYHDGAAALQGLQDNPPDVAIFDITLTNTTDKPVRSTVALGLQNVVGWPEVGSGLTSFVDEEGYCGLVMTTQKHEEDSPRFGSMALFTPTEGPAEEAVT